MHYAPRKSSYASFFASVYGMSVNAIIVVCWRKKPLLNLITCQQLETETFSC